MREEKRMAHANATQRTHNTRKQRTDVGRFDTAAWYTVRQTGLPQPLARAVTVT